MYLSKMMEERLNDFKAVRGHLPDRLLVYRDGLSEAQFEMCTTLELPQIKGAVSKVYKDMAHPPILLICAVKRHQTRLFPVNWVGHKSELLDQNFNPKPGVAVFEEITYGKNKDFYLVSHRTLQGTCRPCHYVVLHNEMDNISITDVANAVSLCPNVVKLLTRVIQTHHLCYLYARSTTSVSVATPAYYADLACDRARFYVRKWYVPPHVRKGEGPVPYDEEAFAACLEVHDDMKNSMFYL